MSALKRIELKVGGWIAGVRHEAGEVIDTAERWADDLIGRGHAVASKAPLTADAPAKPAQAPTKTANAGAGGGTDAAPAPDSSTKT